MWRIFRIVFVKELRELLRDRKSLFWLFAPPIILPAIAVVAATFIGGQVTRYVTDGFPILLVNEAAAPELAAKLRGADALLVGGENPLVTVTFAEDFMTSLQSGGTARVTLTARDSTFVTTLALAAVRSEISFYGEAVAAQRLASLGVRSDYLSPVAIEQTATETASEAVTASVAPSGSQGGLTSGLGALFLPLAITSWLVGGGLGLIVDTTVGEKERQTIENILVTPANRIGIVLGKLSVVFLASLVVMGLWMLEGMALSVVADVGPQLYGADLTQASALIGSAAGNLIGFVALLLLLLVPFIILLNSLVMAFCSFASSYRESNTFLFLIQLALPALVLLSVFSIGPDAGGGWYVAPLLGTIIAIRDLFGQNLSGSGLIVATVSATGYGIAALALAAWIYSREWALTRR